MSKLSDVCLCENKKNDKLDESEISVSIYPNPASTKLYVQFNSIHSGKMEILDMNGRKLKQKDISGTNNHIMVDDLASGEYIISINSDSYSHSEKFIKN